MTFRQGIDRFIADMRVQSRINSDETERGYRGCLEAHAEDVENRDPAYTNREDVKRTLRRWSHPNSQRKQRSILVSFYDWMVEEGYRPHNPARQTRRPKKRPAQVYRLTRAEVVAMLRAAKTARERRAIFLGFCAGLRRKELLGAQGRHFLRAGFVWVSEDIGKGNRYRWVPVIEELAPVVEEILADVKSNEYVLPAQRWSDPGVNQRREDKRHHPSSPQALYYLVKRIGRRAGIAAEVHPHLLRHGFADHIARHAGTRNAQLLLGHKNIATTEDYLSTASPDELAAAVQGFRFGLDSPSVSEPLFQGAPAWAANPLEAPTGIEPVWPSARTVERLSLVLRELFASPVLREAARGMAP